MVKRQYKTCLAKAILEKIASLRDIGENRRSARQQ
jgi:hypothetical protein